MEATLEDSGEYECRAENSAGTASVTATIEVLQAPMITLSPNKTQLTITEGDELQIHCSAVGKPSPNVHFKYPESSSRSMIPNRQIS